MIKDTFSALLSLFFPFPISTMRVPPQLELLTGKLDTVKGQRSGLLLGRPKLITATCMSVSSNQKQDKCTSTKAKFFSWLIWTAMIGFSAEVLSWLSTIAWFINVMISC